MILHWDLFFAFVSGGLIEWFYERVREYQRLKKKSQGGLK